MEEDLEWEDNPSNIPFGYHMLAGSIAGLMEHVCMFPVDTLKTHLQCERCGSISPMQTWRCATGIVEKEGIFRLWRGVSAMFLGCIPAHAAYFSIFEGMKRLLGADRIGHHPVAAAACGAVAALSHDSIITPFDTVKQRMQLGHYRSVFHCVQSIVRDEGARALYKSLPTTLAMNLPYGCIMVAVNESMRKALTKNADEPATISTLMVSGSVAGAVASILTTPLDVVKTRLQVQHLQPCPRLSGVVAGVNSTASSLDGVTVTRVGGSTTTAATAASASASASASMSSLPHMQQHTTQLANHLERGPMQIFKEVVTQEGYAGFFRGAVPRMLVHVPSVAVSWTTYETVKRFLINESD